MSIIFPTPAILYPLSSILASSLCIRRSSPIAPCQLPSHRHLSTPALRKLYPWGIPRRVNRDHQSCSPCRRPFAPTGPSSHLFSPQLLPFHWWPSSPLPPNTSTLYIIMYIEPSVHITNLHGLWKMQHISVCSLSPPADLHFMWIHMYRQILNTSNAGSNGRSWVARCEHFGRTEGMIFQPHDYTILWVLRTEVKEKKITPQKLFLRAASAYRSSSTTSHPVLHNIP